MNNDFSTNEKMTQEEQKKKIGRLQHIVDTTQHNIEVSEEIIAETPHNVQQERLEERNKNRKLAIAGLQKGIQEIK